MTPSENAVARGAFAPPIIAIIGAAARSSPLQIVGCRGAVTASTAMLLPTSHHAADRPIPVTERVRVGLLLGKDMVLGAEQPVTVAPIPAPPN